jgi:putative transferase (TIGR04331 family)
MNRYEVEDALATIRPLRAVLLKHMASTIGDYAAMHRSDRYVDLLLGDWLDNFLHTLVLAMRLPFAPESAAQCHAIPVTVEALDYHRRSLRSPDFLPCLKALAEAAAANQITAWDFEKQQIDLQIGASAGALVKALGSLPAQAAQLMIAYPAFQSRRKDWLAGLWRLRKLARWNEPRGKIAFRSSLDRGWRLERAAAACLAPAVPLEAVAKALAVLLVPVSLLEGYAECRRQALLLKERRPLAVYTSTGLHHHFLFKLLLAEWQSEGTRLLVHQHGGGYGIDRLHALEDYEMGTSERYFTWGWQRPPFTTEPLSPPALPAVPRVASTQVVLVCTEHPRHDFRLHFHPMSDRLPRMIADIVDFAVRAGSDHQVLVRLAADQGWHIRKHLQDAAPNVVIDDGRQSVFFRYATSVLAVHSYLGTSWLETLALNCPTLCFYDPGAYAFRDSVEPYIQALKNAGILHESGRSAADFLATLGNDPAGWWNAAEVQDARRQFVFHYARWSSDWAGDWQRAFESAIEA